VYDNPRSVFVASFIGDANLVDAEVTPSSSAVSTEASALGTTMPARCNGPLTGPEATLVVRPDRITVDSARPEGPAVAVTITDITFQGSTVRLTGDATSGESIFAHPRRFSVEGLPRVGEVSWWSWAPDAALVLDGRRPAGDLEP
jgi:spermidine/putrescine transport system ATP-binding protein